MGIYKTSHSHCRTANFWKRIGGQYHTSIGTSGFELSAEGSKVLINRPIASTTKQIAKAREGLSVEIGADVLAIANIIYWGSQLF